MLSINPEQVQYLAIAYFGRPADPASVSVWTASGLSSEAIVLNLVASDEYKQKTIALNTTGSILDLAGLVNSYYVRLFGRNAAATEVAGWTQALATGQVNADYLGITILNAGFNLSVTTEVKQVLTAKFNSAQLFTGILFNNAATAIAYNGAGAVANGIAYLNMVTTSRGATLPQAQASIDALPLGGGSGDQSFTCSVNSSTSGQVLISKINTNAFVAGYVIVAGSGDDVIVGCGGADVITTGTGSDQVAYITGDSSEVSSQATMSGFGGIADIVGIADINGKSKCRVW